MATLYILEAICILQTSALIFSVYCLHRAGKLLNEYEEFYNNSLEDVELHIKYLDKLMRENVILQGDDSVKKVFRSMKSFYEMLAGYHGASKNKLKAKQNNQ